ncbi:MAG: DUF302 domain-containing protein [Candidatus Krumholzibacteria bacterium]|nr:DUF302 domain-containing protein [Candidatus Krumholzibacteria bacterium]
MNYGYQKKLRGESFDYAIERVTAALKEEGFGILTEIDVKDTLKKKLDVDFHRYMILGACNPNLAHQALGAESQIGLLLPCNVVVQETNDGEVVVSIADPKAMFAMVNNESLRAVANEADKRLARVMETL